MKATDACSSVDGPPGGLACADRQARKQQYLFLGLCLAVPLLATVAYLCNVMPVKCGDLADSDCYMRLLRVEKLWATGRWYDPVCERSNAPYGETLHWTRPLDVLLIFGAAPLSPFADFRTALFWWGVVISPVLLFCTLAVFPWVVRPLLSGDGPRLASVLLVGQLGVLQVFQPGRPDHHSLLLFLFVLSLGLALRLVRQPFRPALCYAAGAVAAVSVWVSIEGLFPTVVTIVVLGGLWIRRTGDFVDKCLHYGLATFGFLGIALLIERPGHDLATVEFDRLSVVFVCLFGLVTAVFAGFRVLRRRSGRLLMGVAGGFLILVAMALLFPGFSHGPWADVDPAVARVYLANVAEVQPMLWPRMQWVLGVPVIGMTALCLPCLLLKSLRGDARAAWLLICLQFVLFFGLCVLQIRWCAYAQVLLIWPTAGLLKAVWARLDRWTSLICRALAKASLVFGCISLFVLAGAVAETIVVPEAEGPSQESDLTPICQYLGTAEPWKDRQVLVLTHIFWGGEMLYRTRHEVVGSPYHRNRAGILDTYHVLTAETDEDALRIVRQRGVCLLLLCPESKEGCFYREAGERSTFYERLCEGALPPWCCEIKLPEELSSMRLFEVRWL